MLGGAPSRDFIARRFICFRLSSFVLSDAMPKAYFAPFSRLAADNGAHPLIGYNDVIALFHG
ncbi:MAG: hypothetical protein CBARDMAM_4302 [uncultured Caballeronia sp.]|nr:MAG: hypothetical protein CBARDMAM_4302 [uncultured Caballeronia sp.]